MPEIDFDRFDVLTFDCYGTLIDWEAGLLAALRDALPGSARTDDELLEEYARHEAEAERGPYRRYRDVLRPACGCRRERGERTRRRRRGAVLGERCRLAGVPGLLRGPDAAPRAFGLGVITNCDIDLFAASAEKLGVAFTWVVTAEQARAYKPSRRPFELAFDAIDVPGDRILHVAQSLYHDHAPAHELGLTSVWIDRRRDRPGFGATPAAEASPAAAYPSMAAFADAAV